MKRRRFGHGFHRREDRPTLASRRLEAATRDLVAADAIRRLLAEGAEVTPIGARAILRLPGDPRSKEFPSELVERVKLERMPLADAIRDA